MAGTIRAISRALSLLRAMGETRDYSLSHLSDLTGLPKPTIFRILSTFIAEGLVMQSEPTGTYRLSSRVQELGRGFTDRSLIVEVSVPIVEEVTAQIKWPLGVGVLDKDEMVVKVSTMPRSPLGVLPTTVGHRHNLATSAMGLAYLSACSDVERDILIKAVVEKPEAIKLGHDGLASLVKLTKVHGYGLRLPRKRGDSATIAVALRHGGEVFGALGMTTFGSMMNRDTIEKHYPILQATASRIVQDYLAKSGIGAVSGHGADDAPPAHSFTKRNA